MSNGSSHATSGRPLSTLSLSLIASPDRAEYVHEYPPASPPHPSRPQCARAYVLELELVRRLSEPAGARTDDGRHLKEAAQDCPVLLAEVIHWSAAPVGANAEGLRWNRQVDRGFIGAVDQSGHRLLAIWNSWSSFLSRQPRPCPGTAPAARSRAVPQSRPAPRRCQHVVVPAQKGLMAADSPAAGRR